MATITINAITQMTMAHILMYPYSSNYKSNKCVDIIMLRHISNAERGGLLLLIDMIVTLQ
jgi:hypothetical protein